MQRRACWKMRSRWRSGLEGSWPGRLRLGGDTVHTAALRPPLGGEWGSVIPGDEMGQNEYGQEAWNDRTGERERGRWGSGRLFYLRRLETCPCFGLEPAGSHREGRTLPYPLGAGGGGVRGRFEIKTKRVLLPPRPWLPYPLRGGEGGGVRELFWC
jgi:hypothetical protein